MVPLGNAGLLSLWESGQMLHPLDRGLLVVRSALARTADESVTDWPLGARNEILAKIHYECFGALLQGWTECEACGEKLEFSVDSQALIRRQEDRNTEAIRVKGQTFRVPTSRDLAQIAGEHDVETAAMRLRDSCRIPDSETHCAEGEVMAAWSSEDLEELGERMMRADPLAEITLSFECPSCKSASEQTLDLPAFLWAEIDTYARRLFEEIHVLAAAYGWSEENILALSEARRALYLRMVQT